MPVLIANYFVAQQFPRRTVRNEELSHRAHGLAERLQVGPLDVFVGAISSKNDVIAAFNIGSQILVSEAAVQQLDRAEMEFILAHEVAHLKHVRFCRGRSPSPVAVFLVGVTAGIVLAVFRASALDGHPLVVVFVLGLVLIAVIKAIQATGRSRELELRADGEALQATRDLAAALAVIAKLQGPSDKMEKLESHPTNANRIDNLRQVAASNGIG
jgi:Zn-dependent protease with chaperone function